MTSAQRVANDRNCQMLYRYDMNTLTSPDGAELTTAGAGLEGWYSSNPQARVVSAVRSTLEGIAHEVQQSTPISFFVCQEGEHYVTLPYSVVICKVYAFIKSPAGLKFLSNEQMETLIQKLKEANEPYRTMIFKQLTLPLTVSRSQYDYSVSRISEYVREWGMRMASPAPLCPSQKDLYATIALQRIQAEITNDKIGIDFPNTWTFHDITSGWTKWYADKYPKAEIPVLIY